MDKKLLGKRINMARKERGWTGERLAETCSINATYLRQIEAGSKVPSLPVFVSLCQALNVSPTYLLVEVLPQQGNQDIDALLELLQAATPKQLNMMVSMLRGALEASRRNAPPTGGPANRGLRRYRRVHPPDRTASPPAAPRPTQCPRSCRAALLRRRPAR